jgi:hypothetical protein
VKGILLYLESFIIKWLGLEGAHYLVELPSPVQYGEYGMLKAFNVHSTGQIKGIIRMGRIQEKRVWTSYEKDTRIRYLDKYKYKDVMAVKSDLRM